MPFPFKITNCGFLIQLLSDPKASALVALLAAGGTAASVVMGTGLLVTGAVAVVGVASLGGSFFQNRSQLGCFKDSSWKRKQSVNSDSCVSLPNNAIHSYSEQRLEKGFGYAVTRGGRSKQEDALFWEHLPHDVLISKDSNKLLSPAQIAQRLWASHSISDAMLGSDGFECGSTMATGIYDGEDSIISSVVGDAAIFAIEYNHTGAVNKVVRLNQLTHKPTEESEYKRITNGGGKISDQFGMSWKFGEPYESIPRLGGGLAVTRALGDHCYKLHNILPYPHMHIYSVPQDTKVQMLVCSDGFTDAARSDSRLTQEAYLFSAIQAILQKHGVLDEATLAEELCGRAILDGSQDNISVGIQTLKHGVSMIMGDCDGHSGAFVSTYAALNLGEHFKEVCQLTENSFSHQWYWASGEKNQYSNDNNPCDDNTFIKPSGLNTTAVALPELSIELQPRF